MRPGDRRLAVALFIASGMFAVATMVLAVIAAWTVGDNSGRWGGTALITALCAVFLWGFGLVVGDL
jgi:ABC-type polysaccharide/polyol phosphate export permease